MNKTIAIGIVTYNRHSVLKRNLECLFSQTKAPDQIIIIDSSDKAFEGNALNKLSQKTEVIYKKLEKRTSAPVGRNLVLKLCNTDIITFIDDDALAKERFIESVLENFNNEEIAGVTGPTINTDNDLIYKEKIISDNKKRAFVMPWGDVYSDTRRWVPTRKVKCQTMAGGNMSFRLNQLRAIGGFDENYPVPSFREETDPQIKLLRLGYNFLYDPQVFVYHIVSQAGGIEDIEEKRNKYFFLAGQNHKYFCDKYYPKWLTRLAWIFWNRTPPNLILATILTIVRKENYLNWHKGLWSKK